MHSFVLEFKRAGFFANDLSTEATLDVDLADLKITGIYLDLKASLIDGVSPEAFQKIADGAKANCIVSKVLRVPITLKFLTNNDGDLMPVAFLEWRYHAGTEMDRECLGKMVCS